MINVPILNWIEAYRCQLNSHVIPVTLAELPDWQLINGRICRPDGCFFSIDAFHRSDTGERVPLINQPEIGILGLLISPMAGQTGLLLQAKSEPGNVNVTQIGPSVQATRSNYMRSHGGASQPFLEQFTERALWRGVRQSEQGTRFYNKYNLSAVQSIDPIHLVNADSKYHLTPLIDVLRSINTDFLFNTDFKSVLTLLLPEIIELTSSRSLLGKRLLDSFRHPGESRYVADFKKRRTPHPVRMIALEDLNNWRIDPTGLHPENPYDHGIHYIDVILEDREIQSWSQPIIYDAPVDYIQLCISKSDPLTVLFRDRSEIGFLNGTQLGPTVQSYDPVDRNGVLLAEFQQSEEGGRFDQQISQYRIVEVDASEWSDDPSVVALTMAQVWTELQIPGVFTNEARSALSGLLGSAAS